MVLENTFIRITTLTTLISSFCSSAAIFVYFIWLVVDPIPSNTFYFKHKSHYMRLVATVFNYLSKIFLFTIFNGRLYYTFSTTTTSTKKFPKWLFISLNIFIFVLGSASITIGYLGVLIYRNGLMEWVGFNLYRFIYIILLLYISIEFNIRLVSIIKGLILNSAMKTVHDIELQIKDKEISKTESTTAKETSEQGKTDVIKKDLLDHNAQSIKYISLVIRSSVLLFWIIFFMCCVSVGWLVHIYAYKKDHGSMCAALVVMGYDAFANVFCVLLLFSFSDKLYNVFCKCSYQKDNVLGFHRCFQSCVTHLVVKSVNK